ncbi:MAG: hypothetical protein D6800_05845 [Candidatus Zixiibacteriota bacterium]|nr:MAG: hypothetical protein D6800_05845 [candidate division Zixibacteria bacterium]
MAYEDKLLDHEYDGIRELDNQLPRWWLYLFYGTIIWGVLYLLYFHVFHIGYSQADQYRKEMDPNYVRASAADTRFLGIMPDYHSPYFKLHGDMTPRRRALQSGQPQFVMMTAETDTATYEPLTEPASISKGAEIFQQRCAQCHGRLGQGNIGPNLTDDYWLHGAGMTHVVKSIKYGYPAKGMISWRGILKEDQILEVASYVLTLRGTNPPNPKAPQGELVTD